MLLQLLLHPNITSSISSPTPRSNSFQASRFLRDRHREIRFVDFTLVNPTAIPSLQKNRFPLNSQSRSTYSSPTRLGRRPRSKLPHIPHDPRKNRETTQSSSLSPSKRLTTVPIKKPQCSSGSARLLKQIETLA
ncbi:hypothetical protein KC19_5G116000 [Ceratodon purpureus]|uniref:Uncharacterized protein n=1 Tax=Ceratodon purpureus TaxID=3225 RepID=A0A8T0I195_CERPU|nr:hypothetical protein KC19_5G116000 [Ceratodon purpureus]